MGVFMNYFIREVVEKSSGFETELFIAIIIGILIILAIIILTIIKKLSD